MRSERGTGMKWKKRRAPKKNRQINVKTKAKRREKKKKKEREKSEWSRRQKAL